MGQASLWGLDRIELAFTVEDRHTAGEIRRAAVQRCGLPGIPSDYVLVLIESAPGASPHGQAHLYRASAFPFLTVRHHWLVRCGAPLCRERADSVGPRVALYHPRPRHQHRDGVPAAGTRLGHSVCQELPTAAHCQPAAAGGGCVADRQLRKSVSLRSLVAVADSGSPLAAAADNQGPTPLAPPTLAPLPIADVSDSLLWQMYGPILNDLLVSALAQVDHIVNAHQVRLVRWPGPALNSVVY